MHLLYFVFLFLTVRVYERKRWEWFQNHWVTRYAVEAVRHYCDTVLRFTNRAGKILWGFLPSEIKKNKTVFQNDVWGGYMKKQRDFFRAESLNTGTVFRSADRGRNRSCYCAECCFYRTFFTIRMVRGYDTNGYIQHVWQHDRSPKGFGCFL